MIRCSLTVMKSIGRAALLLVATVAVLEGLANVAMAVPPRTPEINPGLMGSSAALLTGGIFLIRDMIRRK